MAIQKKTLNSGKVSTPKTSTKTKSTPAPSPKLKTAVKFVY